jgi:hypothetical protein
MVPIVGHEFLRRPDGDRIEGLPLTLENQADKIEGGREHNPG